jgi:hypothetical protein
MKELVSVLIPILNPELTVLEEMVLRHCLEAVAKYPVILFTYEGADLSHIEMNHDRLEVLTFKRKYFESRETLSNLFLMEDFYNRFTWSTFILIHELNSWIIKDEIYYWCKQGYDYLHTNPVLDNSVFKNGKVNDFSRIIGLNEKQKKALGRSFKEDGLKLCHVQRMISTLSAKKKEAHQYRQHDHFENKDSLFWELEANRLWPYLRKPTEIVQSRFSQNISHKSELFPDNRDKWPTGITGVTTKNIDHLPFYR